MYQIPLKTPQAARQLNRSHRQLIYAIQTGKLPAPPRDGSGDYLWFDDQLEAARRLFAANKRQDQLNPWQEPIARA
jgi:hypothetical protein